MILKTHKGYSLLEIMIGMGIVATILVGVVQMARTINDNMKKSGTKSIVMAVQSGIDRFKIDLSRYPSKLDELINSPADVEEKRRWGGPYVDKGYISGGVVKDKFGNELDYNYDSAKDTYQIRSWGPKGVGSEEGNVFAD